MVNSVGSSPLARGLPIPVVQRHRLLRIIPARAGFTPPSRVSRTAARDHPRSRGVYPPLPRGISLRRGSSPLARGLLLVEAADGGAEGIIPARAGFTGIRERPTTHEWDHPRSRGVYPEDLVLFTTPEGSSPLARGLLASILPRGFRPGIIPARAGFTWADFAQVFGS